MNTPYLLSNARVAILGLGLMGGSLAMALRGHCARLLGVDRDEETVSLADNWKILDHVSSEAAAVLPEADIIILAVPVGAIIYLLQELPALVPGCPVVLDIGSTKVKIMEAMAALPTRFDPLGGHPMCGKASASLSNAEAGLFQGAPFAFTPLPRTSGRARSLAAQLAQAVGSRPIWLDPHIHDRWTAATSHLPYLLACALAVATPKEASPLIGPGFHSATRLAGTPSSVMLDILLTNKQNILESLGRFRERLALIDDHLRREDAESLEELLSWSTDYRKDITAGLEKD